MARPQILTAIDLGTDKCVTLITQLDPELPSGWQVIGVSIVPTRGMKRSQIVNLEAIITTLTESLNAAERMAGISITQALISISGSHISSRNSKGVVAVANPTQEIVTDDVQRVIEAAKAISLPPDKEIIHIIPRDFTVDAQTGIKDPVGMTGVRLESEAHLITAMSTALKNTEKCVLDVGLQVESFVFSGLASAYATLTETEKELGVVAIDIGAGTTSISAYVDSSLAFSSTLPIGARHITQDVALGTRISLEAAEKIKIELSNNPPSAITRQPGESKDDLNKRRQQDNNLNLTKLGIQETNEAISKKTVIEGIMVPRLKEIMELVKVALTEAEVLDLVPAGVVFSGGGAQTVGMVETAKRVLNLPARVAEMPKLPGITHELNQPAFATSIGLLLYGKEQLSETGRIRRGGGNPFGNFSLDLSGLTKAISNLIKALLP